MKRKHSGRFSFKRSRAVMNKSDELTSSRVTNTCILNPIHEVSWSDIRLITSQYSIQDPFDEFLFDTATATTTTAIHHLE